MMSCTASPNDSDEEVRLFEVELATTAESCKASTNDSDEELSANTGNGGSKSSDESAQTE